MMTLQLMQTVVATVNDRWESPLANTLMARWAHDNGSAKFWRASTNFVFFFKRAEQEYVLRFNHADFDDSAVYPFVADISLALSDLFDDDPDKVDFQQETFRHFINGYRTARPLPEEELQLIPLFLRLQNLVTYARIQRALTPVNPAGELPWMAG